MHMKVCILNISQLQHMFYIDLFIIATLFQLSERKSDSCGVNTSNWMKWTKNQGNQSCRYDQPNQRRLPNWVINIADYWSHREAWNVDDKNIENRTVILVHCTAAMSKFYHKCVSAQTETIFIEKCCNSWYCYNNLLSGRIRAKLWWGSTFEHLEIKTVMKVVANIFSDKCCSLFAIFK
jgi:hypothetical protein